MNATLPRPPIAVIIVMGVCGCGKSTLGAELAHHLGWAYVEGDDLHPASNIETMRRGLPLTDEMRRPWLTVIAGKIDDHRKAGIGVVVSCSALRRSYRDILIDGHRDVLFVHLDLDPRILAERMASRTDHFMPSTLLGSQLRTLQPLSTDEPGVSFRSAVTAEAVTEAIGSKIALEARLSAIELVTFDRKNTRRSHEEKT